MAAQIFLGIDPGASGGLVAIDGTGCVDDDIYPFKGENDFCTVLQEFSTWHRKFAVIEKLTGYVGSCPVPGHTMFKLGRNVGVTVGYLIALGIPFEEVTPQKWQKEFGIARRPKEKKSSFKGRIKEVAQKLFPDVKVTLKICDALLIAEYARRKHGGK